MPGPKCTICHSGQRRSIESAIAIGESDAWIANTYHVGTSKVRTHRKHARLDAATKTPDPPDAAGHGASATSTFPVAPSGGSREVDAREVATESVAMVREQLRKLGDNGAAVNPKTLVAIVNSLDRVTRTLAKMSHANEISEAALAKHPAFLRLLDAFVSALEPFPGAAAAVLAALRKSLGEAAP